MDTKLVGDLSEAMVKVELLKRGCDVLQPVGDRLPYDLVVDIGSKFIRLQVKTAYKTNNTWSAGLNNSLTNRLVYKSKKPDYVRIDFFVIVIQEIPAFYIIPISLIKLIPGMVTLSPHHNRKADEYMIEQCKNAWGQLI